MSMLNLINYWCRYSNLVLVLMLNPHSSRKKLYRGVRALIFCVIQCQTLIAENFGKKPLYMFYRNLFINKLLKDLLNNPKKLDINTQIKLPHFGFG